MACLAERSGQGPARERRRADGGVDPACDHARRTAWRLDAAPHVDRGDFGWGRTLLVFASLIVANGDRVASQFKTIMSREKLSASPRARMPADDTQRPLIIRLRNGLLFWK